MEEALPTFFTFTSSFFLFMEVGLNGGPNFVVRHPVEVVEFVAERFSDVGFIFHV